MERWIVRLTRSSLRVVKQFLAYAVLNSFQRYFVSLVRLFYFQDLSSVFAVFRKALTNCGHIYLTIFNLKVLKHV